MLSLAPTARGVSIESQLAQTEYSAANGWYQDGAENNGYFPLVDFQNGNTLVSLKTVDTTVTTWLPRMKSVIDELGSSGASIMSLNLYAIDRFGQTVMEYIETVPGELPIDAVGLWQIVPAGRQGFGLSGDDLTDFVRRCIHALLACGAKPVIGGKGTKYDWLFQPQYGESSEDIVNAIINEWLAAGSGDCDPGGLWFALSSPCVGKS